MAQALAGELPSMPKPTAWPVEFSVQGLKPEQTIVEPGGSSLVCQVPVRNAGTEAFSGQAKFLLVDFWLKQRDSRTIELNLAAGKQRTLEIPFTPAKSGEFKVAVVMQQQGATLAGTWPVSRHA